MFARTSIHCTEATLLLKLKWHLAGSVTRLNLDHLLATEKSAFLVQERAF